MRLLIIGFCLLVFQLRGQDSIRTGSFEATFFKGIILSHAEDINHLITGHPNGLILSYNFKTFCVCAESLSTNNVIIPAVVISPVSKFNVIKIEHIEA